MRIVIIGTGGRLGAALARDYATTFDVRAYTRADLDHKAAGVHQQRAVINRSVGLVCCRHTKNRINKKPLLWQRGGVA